MITKDSISHRFRVLAITACCMLLIVMFLRSVLLLASGTNIGLAYTIPTHAPSQQLQLSGDGTFQISVFEDLHFGEAEDTDWGPQQDVNTTRVMNSVLDTEISQLVVLNGDLITGENTHLENSTLYIDQIVQPLVARGLNWASTYGNHDSDVNVSRSEIFTREKRYKNSLTADMVNDTNAGVSNYYLPIFNHPSSCNTSTNATETSIPAFLLYFFDSRGGNYFQQTHVSSGAAIPQPNWVDPSVVAWFNTTHTSLLEKYKRVIPSIAFVHIPVNAMLAFQQSKGGVDKNREPGINDDSPLAAQGSSDAQGTASAGNEYEGQDRPFMEALLGAEGLVGVFSGHDHGDSWCQRWNTTLPGLNLIGNGLNLCFGQHTGYGGYGSWIRGSRQILLRKNSSEIETWIRLEDGTVSGNVVLNATYGTDRYPAVANRDSYGGTL